MNRKSFENYIMDEYCRQNTLLLSLSRDFFIIENDIRAAEEVISLADINCNSRKDALFRQLYDDEKTRAMLVKLMDKSSSDIMSDDEKAVRQKLLDTVYYEECLQKLKDDIVIRKKEVSILTKQINLIEYKMKMSDYSHSAELISELEKIMSKASVLKSEDLSTRIQSGLSCI